MPEYIGVKLVPGVGISLPVKIYSVLKCMLVSGLLSASRNYTSDDCVFAVLLSLQAMDFRNGFVRVCYNPSMASYMLCTAPW